MRKLVVAATLSFTVALSAGCAAPGVTEEEGSERLERARADVRLDSLLSNSRVTLVERDGVLVFGGSVDSLQDYNIVRDIVDEMEDEGAVSNTVVFLGGGTDGPTDPESDS